MSAAKQVIQCEVEALDVEIAYVMNLPTYRLAAREHPALRAIFGGYLDRLKSARRELLDHLEVHCK